MQERRFPPFAYNPITGEINDSLSRDVCWSSVNFREAAPDVMTPSTWSMYWYYIHITTPVHFPRGYSAGGNICGRMYFNISLISSLYHVMGLDARKGTMGDLLGSMPADLNLPFLPVTRREVLTQVLPGLIQDRILTRRDQREFEGYLPGHRAFCQALAERIAGCKTTAELLYLWQTSLWPARVRDFRMLRSITLGFSEPATRLNLDLCALVGESEARTLQSNLSGEDGDLECMGPLVGLAQLKLGKISRVEYLERYGHRGPHEAELSTPTLSEEPGGLERLLEEYSKSKIDGLTALAHQRSEAQAAWQRLAQQYPRQAPQLRRRTEVVARAAKRRELIRSEAIRLSRQIRRFLLRAGDVSGVGDGIFFLTLDEISALLGGERDVVGRIEARRRAYLRYCSLPAYPAIIFGRFDPFQWAADPMRRSDFFDARQVSRPALSHETIQGFAGAAGCVEGTVRRVERVEDSSQIQAGEILVTTITNIGWTPIFPRLAAIVTDIGAPLSHAAIVARELGIPAVVGCGNATALLKTGDRVRVDGVRGIVERVQDGVG
jgi:pyruvate,water dikinase